MTLDDLLSFVIDQQEADDHITQAEDTIQKQEDTLPKIPEEPLPSVEKTQNKSIVMEGSVEQLDQVQDKAEEETVLEDEKNAEISINEIKPILKAESQPSVEEWLTLPDEETLAYVQNRIDDYSVAKEPLPSESVKNDIPIELELVIDHTESSALVDNETPNDFGIQNEANINDHLEPTTENTFECSEPLPLQEDYTVIPDTIEPEGDSLPSLRIDKLVFEPDKIAETGFENPDEEESLMEPSSPLQTDEIFESDEVFETEEIFESDEVFETEAVFETETNVIKTEMISELPESEPLVDRSMEKPNEEIILNEDPDIFDEEIIIDNLSIEDIVFEEVSVDSVPKFGSLFEEVSDFPKTEPEKARTFQSLREDLDKQISNVFEEIEDEDLRISKSLSKLFDEP